MPTSCPAPPYYSISSISQGYMLYESLRNKSRDPAQHRTHASAWEIWIFEGSKIDRRMHFVRIFAFFKILEFLVILASFQAQIWIPGAISCPGVLPDRPGCKFHSRSIFSHMHYFFAFICRPCEPQSSSARPPQNLKPRWADSFFIVVSMSEFGVLIEFSYFTHNAKHHQNSQKMALQGAVGALEANLPTSCPAPPYYSISSISKGYKLYESFEIFDPSSS